jgi:hypothetical protein
MWNGYVSFRNRIQVIVLLQRLSLPNFIKALEEWADKKVAWEFLKSINETPGLEWATINMEDADTWTNWQTEVANYFGEAGKDRLFRGFIDAQYINEETIERC